MFGVLESVKKNKLQIIKKKKIMLSIYQIGGELCFIKRSHFLSQIILLFYHYCTMEMKPKV